jgi:hypothetical protein
MKFSRLLVVIPTIFLFGCAEIIAPRLSSARSLTDIVINKVATFNDKLILELQSLENELRTEADRVSRVKCRIMPLGALMRFAYNSLENSQKVEEDCGLWINPISSYWDR